jgi:hypothetical protein
MPTLDMGYPLASKRVRSVLRSSDTRKLLDHLKEVLITAGWSDNGGIPAVMQLKMPYGLPVQNPPTSPVTLTAAISPPVLILDTGDGPVGFRMYDPTREFEGAPPDAWVPMGVTYQQSVENLVNKISAFTKWNLLVRPGFVNPLFRADPPAPFHPDSFPQWSEVWLEYDEPGTIGNFKPEAGGETDIGKTNGRWVDVVRPYGGGWTLTTPLRDNNDLAVTMTGGGDADGWQAVFIFQGPARENKPRFVLSHGRFGKNDGEDDWPPYTVIANPWQFFIWRQGGTPAPSGGDYPPAVVGEEGWEQHLLASFPYLDPSPPSEPERTSYAAMVLSNQFRDRTHWDNGSWAVARNGDISVRVGPYSGLARHVRPHALAYRLENDPLKDSQGHAIATGCFLGLPGGSTPEMYYANFGAARVAARLWDSIFVSRKAALDEIIRYDGMLWQCVCTNDGSLGRIEGSVFMAFGTPDGGNALGEEL